MEETAHNILTRDQVRATLRFEGAVRPPLAMSLWHNDQTTAGKEEQWQQILQQYPDDCIMSGVGCSYWDAPDDDHNFRWAFGNKQKPPEVPAHVFPVIADWSELDEFLSELPDPNRKATTESTTGQRSRYPDRYILVGFGHYFHQRLAYLRGLTNLLTDFYDHRDKLKIVMQALLGIYEVWAKRLAQSGADGIWAGDDFGTQQGLFMSPEMFRTLYKPFYHELAGILHSNGLDFWLHSCGNITKLLPDLIDIGVDVLHPIQAGTMDDTFITKEYGGKIAFWIGMDVQQMIPFGSPEQVRTHVRNRIKIFSHPGGGMVIGAGNAILRDTPIDNILAYVKEIRLNGKVR